MPATTSRNILRALYLSLALTIVIVILYILYLTVSPIFLAMLRSPDQSFVFAARVDKSHLKIALLEPILFLLIFVVLQKRRVCEPLVQVLPSHLSPVVISYPKDKPPSSAELGRFVKQQVPASEDYVLVAESFSGPIAIEISSTHPANLKALILSATFVSNPALIPRSISILLRGLFFMLEPPRFVVSRYLLGEKPPIDLVESFDRAKRSVPPGVLAFRMRSVHVLK